jgi:hypothetical protein
MTQEITRPEIKTYTVADVKCYLCGTITGTVESEQQPIGRLVTFRRPGDNPNVGTVLDWHKLRCSRCDGPIYLDDSHIVTTRVEHYNWLEERPRRGRPPKRIVEERRRERELLELELGLEAEAA